MLIIMNVRSVVTSQSTLARTVRIHIILDFKGLVRAQSTTTRRKHEHCTFISERMASHRLIVRQPIDMKNIFLQPVTSKGTRTRFNTLTANTIRLIWLVRLRVQIYMHHYFEFNLPLEIVNCDVVASACHSTELIFFWTPAIYPWHRWFRHIACATLFARMPDTLRNKRCYETFHWKASLTQHFEFKFISTGFELRTVTAENQYKFKSTKKIESNFY